MASTYSALKIELIGTGEQDGTWSITTNTNLGTTIEQAITGSGEVTFEGSDVTLVLANSNSAQTARNLRLVCVGVSSGARQLIVPAIEKQYIVKNELADAVTIKNASGTGISIPSGKTMVVFNDATNVVEVTTFAPNFTCTNLTYGGVALPSTVSGTGSMVLAASPAFTGTPTAPTAAPGTSTTQIATTAFVTANNFPSGGIVMWSGSIASIPSGWLLCNGTSGTPDLRDRFIVGAGTTYAVAAVGGAANAIVVSHTHTTTVTDPGHSHNLPLAAWAASGSSRWSGSAGPIGNTVSGTNAASTGITVGVDSAGASGTNANLPPYYALAYIMKA
jgi:hypothetical protein